MNTTPSPLVSLENAGYQIGNKWLVRGVSFSVSKGEIVTLIGPNGSGKSTTVRLALGIYSPVEGKIIKSTGLKVGYVPQKLAIDAMLPLRVNRLMQLSAALSSREIEDALSLTGVGHLAKSEVQSLSGGEFQRVLLARAIARNPELLVLDEPVQGVDFSGEIALYDLILEIRNQLNCGILLVSHDLHVVMAATDNVICLNGHICCRGTPQIVAESDEYLRLFGGGASNILARYEHNHDHTHLPDGTVRHGDGSITNRCHPEDSSHKIAGDEGKEPGNAG